MAAVVRTCIDNLGSATKGASEMTLYRPMAHIFDIILDGTNLEAKRWQYSMKGKYEDFWDQLFHDGTSD
ncbi:unnamed protein product [Absidia cylindrospora]